MADHARWATPPARGEFEQVTIDAARSTRDGRRPPFNFSLVSYWRPKGRVGVGLGKVYRAFYRWATRCKASFTVLHSSGSIPHQVNEIRLIHHRDHSLEGRGLAAGLAVRMVLDLAGGLMS